MSEFVTLRSSGGKVVAKWDFRALSEWLEEEGRVFMEEQKEFDFNLDPATRVFAELLVKGFGDALSSLELKFYASGFDDALRLPECLSTETLSLWESRLGFMKDAISSEITSRRYPPSEGYGPATEADLKAHRYAGKS